MSIRVGVNGFGRIGRVFFRTALGAEGHRGRWRQRPGRRQDPRPPAEARFGARRAAGRGRGQGRGDLRGRARDPGVRASRTPPRCRGKSSASTSWWSRPDSSAIPPPPPSTSRPAPRRSSSPRPPRIPTPRWCSASTRRPTIRPSTGSSPTPPAPPTVWPPPRRCWTTSSASSAASRRRCTPTPTTRTIHDFPHKDLRRARAGAVSMIPTTTGAATAVGLVLPKLKGKLDGIAIRVPTINVSVVDLTVELEKSATVEAVNDAFREAAAGKLSGILDATDEELVSVDFNGNAALARSSTCRRPRSSTATWSRCWPGTTTSGATLHACAT